MSTILEMQIDELQEENNALKAINQKLQLEKNALKEQLALYGVVSSKRKSNTELFNQMNNDFMQAIIDSDNGIYDPIEEFEKELEDKYIIIKK